MRVFVTGGTGFVGAHAVRQLTVRGHDVHQLEGDLLDPRSYSDALEKLRPEACLHLAWYANPADYLSNPVNADLVLATVKLGAKLAELGCRRFVGVGTCFEYDVAHGYLSEATPLGPGHLYSTCKRAAHEMLGYILAGSTELAWARLFFLYGPGEKPGRLVPAVVDALLSGATARVSTGEQIRDFMHVEDAAAALVNVLESNLTGPVNIASGKPVAVREVVATIARQLDASERVAWGAITPRPNDPPFVCADVTKLKSAGFAPRHDLESGLRDTIAWSRSCRK